MFGFGKKKIDKAAWGALVLAFPPTPESAEQIPIEKLRRATEHVFVQKVRIFMESVEIIRRTKNEDTRQGRIDLCRKHYGYFLELKPFATRERQATIRKCGKILAQNGWL